MRKHISWLIGILLVATTLATVQCNKTESAQSKSWQSDWQEFTKDYPKTGGDKTRTKRFVGKDVVWKGKINWVGLTKDEKKTETAVIEMNPPLQLGKFSTETISLNPQQSDWDAWTKLQKGQEVVFRTRLTGPFGDSSDSPVMIFMMNDGRNFAQIFTKGGKLLEVIHESK